MGKAGKITGWIISLALVALVILAALNFNNILDWYKLRGYKAPAQIAQLASDDTMTDYGKKIFYINHPRLTSSRDEFRQDCKIAEQSIVLGCYHGNEAGIFIYDVQDERLAGVTQVTSAHEMLHGAYDRLGTAEKKKIDSELLDFYNNGLEDKRIKDEVNAYKQTEPKDLVNEMHSIFGTEVGSLPSALETYYQKYFNNRAKVVAYSDNYEAAFTSRENQAKALKSQLDSLRVEIESLQSQLQSERASLEEDRNNINSQAEADAYNARVRAYNASVSRYNSLIDEYNNLRDQYNSLVLQENELIKAIDTRSTQLQPAQ